MEKNYRFLIQYDGTRYHGWQKQGNTDQTIQGKLEAVLEVLCKKVIEIHGSGRTDEGVHALAQVANARMDVDKTPEEIKDYVNQYLPEDISVLKVEEAPQRFHSRLNAESKTYLYRIDTAVKRDVFERKYIYGLGQPLDVISMQKAAFLLEGDHDFRSFCGNKKMKKSTNRNIMSIKIETKGSRVFLRFTGNGFLQQMVRIMAGTLIEVGLGKRTPESIADILKAKDRQKAGYTAPSQGLFLEKVCYSS